MSRRKNKKYSKELNLEAVQEYLTSKVRQREIYKKYEIPATRSFCAKQQKSILQK